MARDSPYRLLSGVDTMKELKDCAELSKTLVGAEYGKTEYSKAEYGKKERSGCGWKAFGVAMAVILVAWLLGLTVVRELQLVEVRREVARTRGEVAVLSEQVEKLTQHWETQRSLLNDLNAFEDGVYADLDNSEVVEDSLDEAPSAGEETKPDPPGRGQVQGQGRGHGRDQGQGQLDTITDDDEDMSDDYDGESGYYQDYDHRKREGTSGLEHLEPEQFLGKVLSARAGPAPRASRLSELRRILHRTNAELGAEPAPTLSDTDSKAERQKRSVSDLPPPEEYVDEFAARRMRTDDRRRGRGHKLESETADWTPPEPTHAEGGRHTRNSDEGGSGTPRQSFVAAHFHGNTSHLNTEIHPHYKGNGLVRLAHDAPHNVWWPSDWSRQAPHPAAPVLTRRGHVRVRHDGIYFVYVQIYYLDAHDITGWVLHRHSEDGRDDREPLLQCSSTSPSAERQDKPNSCYSAAALLLREGDRLLVRNTGGDRHSLMQPEKSFIGLIKLADVEAQINDY